MVSASSFEVEPAGLETGDPQPGNVAEGSLGESQREENRCGAWVFGFWVNGQK